MYIASLVLVLSLSDMFTLPFNSTCCDVWTMLLVLHILQLISSLSWFIMLEIGVSCIEYDSYRASPFCVRVCNFQFTSCQYYMREFLLLGWWYGYRDLVIKGLKCRKESTMHVWFSCRTPKYISDIGKFFEWPIPCIKVYLRWGTS